MKAKALLKPSRGRLLAFLIAWLLIPAPTLIIVDPGGVRFEPLPLISPLLSAATLLKIFTDPKSYSLCDVLACLIYLIYPLIAYVSACTLLCGFQALKRRISGLRRRGASEAG